MYVWTLSQQGLSTAQIIVYLVAAHAAQKQNLANVLPQTAYHNIVKTDVAWVLEIVFTQP